MYGVCLFAYLLACLHSLSAVAGSVSAEPSKRLLLVSREVARCVERDVGGRVYVRVVSATPPSIVIVAPVLGGPECVHARARCVEQQQQATLGLDMRDRCEYGSRGLHRCGARAFEPPHQRPLPTAAL